MPRTLHDIIRAKNANPKIKDLSGLRSFIDECIKDGKGRANTESYEKAMEFIEEANAKSKNSEESCIMMIFESFIAVPINYDKRFREDTEILENDPCRKQSGNVILYTGHNAKIKEIILNNKK